MGKFLDAGLEAVIKHSDMIIGYLFPQFEAFDKYKDSIRNDDKLSDSEKAIKLHTARRDFKHIVNQSKIAQIAIESAKEGTDFSDKSGVNEDFIDRFMDSAKFVSDEKLQAMWGKVLAGEFEKPNSTPTSIIRILTELTQEQAEAFAILCNLCVEFQEIDFGRVMKYIMLNGYHNGEETFGLTFGMLNELDSVGLIKHKTDNVSCFVVGFRFNQSDVRITYWKDTSIIRTNKDGSIPIGSVFLTDVGYALARSVEKKEIPGFFESVKKFLKSQNIEFVEENDT